MTAVNDEGWWSGEVTHEAEPIIVQVISSEPRPTQQSQTEQRPTGSRPTRRAGQLALGLAVLAAERVRRGPPSPNFYTAVGFLQQTAAGVGDAARRATAPPAKLAVKAVSQASGWAATLPGAEVPRRSLSRSRDFVNSVVLDARRRGEATVAAGRADAISFVRTTVADGIAWAQTQAVPQIVDGLVPHLVDQVVPRLIDGVMPEVRNTVLPVVIEDLAHDPQLRDLIREQGRGVVSEAADHARSTSATADDRVEEAFRRLVRSPLPETQPDDEPPPGGQAPSGEHNPAG